MLTYLLLAFVFSYLFIVCVLAFFATTNAVRLVLAAKLYGFLGVVFLLVLQRFAFTHFNVGYAPPRKSVL